MGKINTDYKKRKRRIQTKLFTPFNHGVAPLRFTQPSHGGEF